MKPINVTRTISKTIERELWGRAAARCEFHNCNRLLYKSPVTQERVNLSEMAHIYSFSSQGPRGWGPFKWNISNLNNLSNLMLVCHDCHKKIDNDKSGEKYSPELLKSWKHDHENRIRFVTGIQENKKSHVVLYGSRIGDEESPLHEYAAWDAMFPEWFPTDDHAINLSMQSSLDDSEPAFWSAEAAHLERVFEKQIRNLIEAPTESHFSVFGFAPQPLLIQLGALFTDKVPARIYQMHREPRTWKWFSDANNFDFYLTEPQVKTGLPVLVLSLSAKIDFQRIKDVVGENASIWEISISQCHNDFLRSEVQLSKFRITARKALSRISEVYPEAKNIRLFPAMPVACAIELGRLRMPKADLPWIIYDQNNKCGQFIETITIGKYNE